MLFCGFARHLLPPVSCIAFATNLHQSFALPLSKAYAIATAQFAHLRAIHEVATRAAYREARAFGAHAMEEAGELVRTPLPFLPSFAPSPSLNSDPHDSSPVLSPARPDTTRRLRTRSSRGNPQLRPPARPLPPLKRARFCPREESRLRLLVKFGRPTTGCRMSSGEIRLSDRMRPVRLAVGGSTLGGGRSGPSGVSRGGRRRACG